MTLVVDASVAAKWILSEPLSDRAGALKTSGPLIAPALIGAEVGNAIWKAVGRNEFFKDDAPRGLKLVLGLLDRIIPYEDLDVRALELALMLKHPIYDCFYLAVAERENAPLITVDDRLLKIAKRLKSVEVRSL